MNLAEALNQFIATEEHKKLLSERPLYQWPSELLVWLFWTKEVTDLDPGAFAIEEIHREMNARGEGEKVAV